MWHAGNLAPHVRPRASLCASKNTWEKGDHAILKTENCHYASFFVTCSTTRCQKDNHRCHQWRQNWHSLLCRDRPIVLSGCLIMIIYFIFPSNVPVCAISICRFPKGVQMNGSNTSMYCQVSNIRRTLVGNEIVDHSDVVGASPVGAAPTTSSFLTEHMASMDWQKATARRDDNHLSFAIWCVLY